MIHGYLYITNTNLLTSEWINLHDCFNLLMSGSYIKYLKKEFYCL